MLSDVVCLIDIPKNTEVLKVGGVPAISRDSDGGTRDLQDTREITRPHILRFFPCC